MKIRFIRIRNLASSKAKGATHGILLFLLAFAVPRFDNAQEKPNISRPAQQANPASIPYSGNAGTTAKQLSNKTSPGILSTGAITDVNVAAEGGKVTVTMTADRLITPQEFILDNPPRLVFDFLNTENKVQFARLPVNAVSVKQLRVQQFQSSPSQIARIVFDLEEGYGTHETTVDKTSIRIVFHQGQSKSYAGVIVPTSKPVPSQAEISSKPKTQGIQPTLLLVPEPPKIAVNTLKPPLAETAKNTAASTPPAAVQPVRAFAQSGLVQAAVAGTELKPRPAESAAKNLALPARPQPAPANRVPFRSQSSKAPAAGNDPKPHPAAAAAKSRATPASPAAAKPSPTAGPESPKAAVTGSDSKPAPAAESAAKNPATLAPMVAALMPASIPAPPKMIASPSSRFSGQPLTLDLIDIPLVDFFRLMAEEGGINIVLDPEVKGQLSIKVVKVPWDQIFEAALANNGLDKQVEGSLVRIARKSTLQEEARQQEALKKANLLAADLETRVRRLNYAKAPSLIAILADQKTVRGTVVFDERSNSLILTDLPSSLTKLIQLIDTLDVPQPQVEIEARIVSATRNFARDIGIQWGFVDGNLQRVTVGGPNTFGTIGGTRPSATPSSTFAAGNSSTGRGASDDSATDSGAVSTGTSTNNQGNYNVNLAATKAFGGIGISIGNIFDTFLLDAAITAGETKGLAKLISQPKVIAQNNSQAIITQGLRFPVQIIANNTISVQFQNAALTLTVTPQITYEGNIVLDLKVENNTPDFSREVNNMPSIRTSEATTRVLVSDGGTTVIGGILIDDDSTQDDRVPGLGSLPIIGNLFRRNSVSRSTQEVLFFVTPRIVK